MRMARGYRLDLATVSAARIRGHCSGRRAIVPAFIAVDARRPPTGSTAIYTFAGNTAASSTAEA